LKKGIAKKNEDRRWRFSIFYSLSPFVANPLVGDHALDPDVTVSRPLRRLGLDSAKGVRIARS
jgi:hypothetical protein